LHKKNIVGSSASWQAGKLAQPEALRCQQLFCFHLSQKRKSAARDGSGGNGSGGNGSGVGSGGGGGGSGAGDGGTEQVDTCDSSSGPAALQPEMRLGVMTTISTSPHPQGTSRGAHSDADLRARAHSN